MSYKLFIPGPIAVSEKTLRAMAQPMIGHRSTDFVALYQSMQPDLQALFYTQDPVYLSTSSAWGVMEGSLRNVVQKKVLCCMNGSSPASSESSSTFSPSLTTRGGGPSVWLSQNHHFCQSGGALLL